MSDEDDIKHGPGPLNGMRVLIVEDNAATAFLLENVIMEHGGRLVGTCPSVTEAKSCLDKLKIDFLLIDLRLADQFADELISETIGRNLNFVLLTGLRAFPSNIHEHAVAVLRKPVDVPALIRILAGFA